MEENETPYSRHQAVGLGVSTSQQLANALARERGLLAEIKYLNEMVLKLRSLRREVVSYGRERG